MKSRHLKKHQDVWLSTKSLKSLKNIPLKYVALVLVFAGIPAVLLIVFNICDFSIFIPSKYIPNDNIFDLSNYLNVLVDNAQTLNSQSLTGNPMLVNLFSRTFTASLWLTIIFLISWNFVICYFLLDYRIKTKK